LPFSLVVARGPGRIEFTASEPTIYSIGWFVVCFAPAAGLAAENDYVLRITFLRFTFDASRHVKRKT
jgi:hypothetical protein